MVLRVYLAGELCLTSGALLVRTDRFPGRQGRLAFALLAVERARPVARDELIELLWPAEVPRAVDVSLSAVISKLRSLLGEAGLGREALATAAGCYQLRLSGGAWIDLEAAAAGLHEAESALRTNAFASAYGPAVVANAILRRPFLPGDEGAWIDERRRHLTDMRLRALDCLADIHLWNSEPTLALKAAEEAVGLEPYRESGYRRLMNIHHVGGNRAESLRVYESLRALLAADLRTQPDAETRAMFDRVAAEG
jgi:DNA-binding SARP family transcriptional activator